MSRKISILLSLLNLALFVKGAGLPVNRVDSSDIFINGWEYQMVPSRNGHPFVFSKVWQFEEIDSELGTRNDFLMNYDVYQDVLVIQTFLQGNPAQIVLNPANIKSFTIEDHYFINPMKIPELAGTTLKGYYEIIYEGELKFLIKHTKQITDEGSINGRGYEPEQDYFVFLDNTIHTFKNKRNLAKIFPAYKKDISHYMREQNILINSASVSSLKALMSFIDELVNE